jgi:hypothetical protein
MQEVTGDLKLTQSFVGHMMAGRLAEWQWQFSFEPFPSRVGIQNTPNRESLGRTIWRFRFGMLRPPTSLNPISKQHYETVGFSRAFR